VQRRLHHEPNTLNELETLAEAAGYEVVEVIEQTRRADPRFQIGRGKVETLAQSAKEKRADKIIFDNNVKPVQAYNLAKATGVEIIDRFTLILEIFANRASTTEAKLQIQLAKLRYELAHAKEKVRLARMEEQPGFMGLGAYEVEVYKRAIQRQVHTIRKKLYKIRSRRSLHRKQRQKLGFSAISLAGYTYAGKSTLFNTLSKEAQPTNSGLFTTLSTTTRVISLTGSQVLLTDTVGFIDHLPLTLIEAFQATLEETIFSDVILLTLDANEPIKEMRRKLTVSLDTLRTIGAHGIPLLIALNKIDLISERATRQRLISLEDVNARIVPISALKGDNIQILKQELWKILNTQTLVMMVVPITSKIRVFLSWLFTNSDVKKLEYTTKDVRIEFEAPQIIAEKIIGRAKELEGSILAVSACNEGQ
jgi:GTP-binding protein HflX